MAMAKKEKEMKENSFSGWLQRVRKTGEFSDITVIVDGQAFHLHMLPLLNASLYFRSLMPCSSNGYMKQEMNRTVELNGFPGGMEGFSVASDFCYLIKPCYTIENVAKIRAAAHYLGMMELQDSTKKFLYTNVFNHWRSCISFLHQYKKVNTPTTDLYIESRCLKVISSACIKAFFDTHYLSAPINSGSCCSSSSSSSLKTNTWQSSPCQVLTDVLVRVASLPDMYVQQVVSELVNGEVNLTLKCRQGRNVQGWLDHTINVECMTLRAKCWVVICLVKMLENSVTMDRPWLELSSQYWCSLLEHSSYLLGKIQEEDGDEDDDDHHHHHHHHHNDDDDDDDDDTVMVESLQEVVSFLEERIGGSLHELDDYLLSYSFEPHVLLSLVKHFKGVMREVGEKEVDEVASEVDACLLSFVEKAPLCTKDFISFIEAFPPTCRGCHDMLYTGVEKLFDAKGELFTCDEKQRLWSLVDVTKLSGPYRERALGNTSFLVQSHVLEYVLKQHSEELRANGDRHGDDAREDKQRLGHIMQKVIKASLKLLEENSRRSKEIFELQKQYASLMRGGKLGLNIQEDSGGAEANNSPDMVFINNSHHKALMMSNGCVLPDEVEEAPSDTPSV